MNTEFGMKELYDVSLKATYPIEIGNRIIEENETIAVFDKIQLANFQEVKNSVNARGGYDNRGLVFWETTKEIQLTFSQGIFSKTQLTILTGAKLIDATETELSIHKREKLESDENGVIILSHAVEDNSLFIYDAVSGEKLLYNSVDESHVAIEEPFKDVLVDYQYLYTNSYQTLVIGQQLTNGFLQFEGKTRVKDDITGQTHTGIIHIPKLKLMSDLSMRLGRDSMPVVGTFNALAIPTGERNNTQAMSILFLDDDIDSDL